MHVLATVVGSPSHTRSLVIALRPLVAAGHRVSVACPEELAPHVKDEGVEVHAVLPNPLASMINGTELAKGPISATEMVGKILNSAPVLDSARALIELIERIKPDLLLRDDAEFGAVLAAEHLGLPHVSLPGGASNLLDPAQGAQLLAGHWRALGHTEPLPADVVYRHGRIDYVPEEFDFAAFPGNGVRRYRQPVLTRTGERLPQWIAELPRTRPFVYAALGTALPALREAPPEVVRNLPLVWQPEQALAAIVEVLSTVDCDALVATVGLPTEALDPAPHVRLVEHAPQPLVLETADLFITHGGYNGVREALRAAAPMVVLPGMGDQPHDGQRITDHGLGRMATETSPALVRELVTEVLGNPAYQRRAKVAQAATLALPELGALATDLAALVQA